MPRKPRFFLPGVPVHVVQRGHNREPVFFDTPDYQTYLHWLEEAAERYQCDIHAYVLMTNHIHLLVTPQNKNSVSLMMQYVGRHYVPYIHNTYGTSGTIWEGRYKASLIQDETYLLTCMRYIELNPVRAGMVKSPGAYRWSSYGVNGLGKDNDLIHAHDLYKALGRTVLQRNQAYRELFKAHVDDGVLNEIRASWQTGTPLGNDHFKEKVEAKLKCKVGQARRGRPSKEL
jgi:putative transposase